MKRSILVGNGLDIQIGGMDFHNKWIITRLLAKAKSGKYDDLFKGPDASTPAVSGDDLTELFSNMPMLGNRARNGEFDSVDDKITAEPLADFISRYPNEIQRPDEIGMEDWIFLMRIYLQEQADLFPFYTAIKQGFERVILDAIYCNGKIQQLHKNVSMKAREFFRGFDKVFTLNYDNTLEKITRKDVFHLHGDYNTKALSENPNTAHGYVRQKNGEAVYFHPKFQHCNCNAILDYSGDSKYSLAVALSNAQSGFKKLKILFGENREEFDSVLSSFPIEQREIIKIGIEQDLPFGYNYHFHDLEQLTGELSIIGIAPQNDSHLFKCIDRSKVDKVVFYHFYLTEDAPSPILPINKDYYVEDVNELWKNIGLHSIPHTSATANKINRYPESQKFLDVFNSFEPMQNSIGIAEICRQLNSIPKETEKVIIEMMRAEIQKASYRSQPKSENELFAQFRNFGRTLEVSSLSPQALYFLYISNSQESNSQMPKSKKSKKIKRRK